MLKAFDIRYAALNPGASFRHLHDSLVNWGGNHAPEIIECPHEEIAVAMAHGYAISSGRPMAAIVHDVVGLQHASIAVYHAFQDRVPILVLGGTGPMDSVTRRPKHDWGHTALVQGNLVRDYTKWDDQPASAGAVPSSFIRGYHVATSAPAGPVYICYDVTVQREEVEASFVMPSLADHPVSTRLAPDDAAIGELARRLVSASSPVIVTEYAGRSPGAATAIAELADLIAAPVIGRPGRFNIPSNHPMHLAAGGRDLTTDADVILAIEVPTLFGFFNTGPRKGRAVQPRPSAWISHITLGDLGIRAWAQGYQEIPAVDQELRAEAGLALPRLVERCRSLQTTRATEAAAERRTAIAARSHAIRKERLRTAEAAAGDRPISIAHLGLQIKHALEGQPFVIAKAMLRDWLWQLMDIERPDQWIGINFGGGLGNSLGYSLGVALDRRDDDVVCVDVQGDGDLMYTPNALWTAAHHKLPLLIVINNNRSYYNSENHAIETARDRGEPVEHAGIGTQIDGPAVDYAGLARSFGVEAAGPIEDPAMLLPALRKAVDVVRRERRPYLVDVVTLHD
jgi:acetolactate synthase I/II/III large subunit